jgi:hypothetical protein
MLKKSRILLLVVMLTVSSTVIFETAKPARAFLINPFEVTVESMLNTIENSVNSILSTILDLSDDIGTMADRILLMADNIGIMADRIVTTEELMANLVTNLNDSSNCSEALSPLLTLPAEGDYVSLSTPINIVISDNNIDYVLFMSNSADMSDATNVLVQGGDTATAWNRASEYATADQLYIAVKSVTENTVGPISNTVMVNLTQ